MRSAVLISVFSLGFIACASPQWPLIYIPPEGPQPRFSLASERDFDRTWEAVIAVFARNQIQISALEKDSGIIVSARSLDAGELSEQYVDLGRIRRSTRKNDTEFRTVQATAKDDRYYAIRDGRCRCAVFVTRSRTRPTVTLDTEWTANVNRVVWSSENRQQVTAHRVKGISTGVFEQALLDEIKAELNSRG